MSLFMLLIFFFKQKTAYEMRISDWSSDVCSSDLGQVADVGLADDRRHVVFAVALELDVAQHDHLVVAGNLLEGALQVLARIVGVAAEPVSVGVDHALGRVEQALPSRIVASPAQQGTPRVLGLPAADAVALFLRSRHGFAPGGGCAW